MSRTLATALIIVGLVSAAGASAGVLTEIEHRVYIQYGGGGVPVTTVFDPLFAEATAGGSHALADYAAGVFKGFAQHSSGGAVATIAYSGLEAKFKNVGAGAIAYGAGDIGISIDASFLRAAGGCCGSQNDTTLIAVLSGRTDGAPRIDGFARSTYQYVESSSPFPFFDFDLTGTSGFTATGSADSTSMSVFLGFPAFTLASEQTLDINFSLQPGAFGGPLPGWEATTDAFNSAQLSMKLPAGVTLQSSVPLAWVTAAPVPEPAVIWLFAAGLLGLWALARPRFVLVTRLQEGQAVPGVGNLTIRARVSAAQARFEPGEGARARRSRMNAFRNLIGAAVLVATMPVSAAEAFVQHLGDVTKSPVIAFASGPGYMLSADLLAGEFKILAEASPSVPTNNNFSGTLHPYEFTNTTGFTITVPAATPPTAAGGATGLQAHVHADLIAGPPVGTAIGGASNTNMRVSGNLFVRILGGAGQGDFLAYGFYQENVIYNVDGTIREFIPDFDTVERNGARVMIGGGGGISVNMDLLMPELVLDPGARLQLSFVGQGDASDSSTTDAWNTSRLSFILPFGVTLDNDIGQPLAWVTNAAAVPEPESLALMGLGLGFVVAFARRQRSGVLAARR